MPRNPKLFPDDYIFESSESAPEAGTLTLTTLQDQAWRGSIRQAYAARVGVESAIRAGNLGLRILQKVLPTRLIGRFVEEKEPSPGTHGYMFGGLELTFEPGRRYYKSNDWMHKVVFEFDLLIPKSVAAWPYRKMHKRMHADVSFGDAEAGFLKYFWIVHQVDFDTDAVRRVAARAHSRYCCVALKGHNDGYSYGGRRWADLYDYIDRFNYEGLIDVTIATRTTRPIHAAMAVENEQHGYVAGGLSDSPRLRAGGVSRSMYRFTFFGEMEAEISATLSLGVWATYGQRGPGNSAVGYFPQGRDWRRFPESSYPLRHIFNEHTDRFELETETRTTIAATVTEPKAHFAILGGDAKGYLMGGIRLGKSYNDYVLAPSYAWWRTQTDDIDVFAIASETWTTLGSTLNQPVQLSMGVDNQLR